MSRTASRRALLSGLASAPVLGLPVMAATPSADAELLTLCRDCLAVSRELDEAIAAAKALAAREEPNRPPQPDTLRRAGDFDHFYDQATNPQSPVFYQRYEALAFTNFSALAGTWCPRAKAASEARAAEIVEAQRRWDEECRLFDEVTGIAEADRRSQRLMDRRFDLGNAIQEMVPTTMEGLFAKSRVGAELGWDEFDRAVLTDLLALGGQA